MHVHITAQESNNKIRQDAEKLYIVTQNISTCKIYENSCFRHPYQPKEPYGQVNWSSLDNYIMCSF